MCYNEFLKGNVMEKDYYAGKGKIELREGDISFYDCKAIVVPANIDFSYDPDIQGVLASIVRTAGREPFEEAIKKAVADLDVSRDTINIKVVCEERKGLFGMEGAKLAKIKVTRKDENNA